jgi:hypothetical protein
MKKLGCDSVTRGGSLNFGDEIFKDDIRTLGGAEVADSNNLLRPRLGDSRIKITMNNVS